MLANFLRTTGFGLATVMPLDLTPYDRVSRDSKTSKDFLTRGPDTETGMDRLYMMYSIDETGAISNEMNSIYQSGFMGFLGGAVYGGFIKSRLAYLDFMENNMATAFKSHFDAKKKLQDMVTINFAKGAFRYGWRLGLFTSAYVGIVTSVSVYRDKSSLYEYLAAGTITGGLYKVNMGLRGMAVGGLLGGGLGGVAGVLSLLVLRLSGTSMEEVRYWQYKWRAERDRTIRQAHKTQAETDELLSEHEMNLNGKRALNLDQLDVTDVKTSTTVAAP